MDIYVGKSITQANDPLIKLSLEELIRKIQQPKIEFQNRIQQLRITASLDVNRYRTLKKELPYFTCGSFYPAYRKKENFSSISLFVLDLDHLHQHEIDTDSLKDILKKDQQVLAFFDSPSKDGLKIIFRLQEPCKDSALFTAFYKIFITFFAKKYSLEKVLDSKTCDVSRACFISWDPEAYFNHDASAIILSNFITHNDFDIAEKELKEAEDFIKEIKKNVVKADNVDGDIIAQIKQRLTPHKQVTNPKHIYIPPEIDNLLPILQNALKEMDIELTSSEPINYGRKIRVKAQIHTAELNLFFGKKGYTLVKTPKTGTNPALADLVYEIIDPIIHPYYYGEA